MPESDLYLLRNAAIGAGKIAMGFYQKNPISWDKGDGQGPVSEADLEIDKMLFNYLSKARPDYSFLSEEAENNTDRYTTCLLYTSPSPRDRQKSRMPSSA